MATQTSQERLEEVSAELQEKRGLVSDLEEQLMTQRTAREVDLELTTLTLSSLQDQLAAIDASNTTAVSPAN